MARTEPGFNRFADTLIHFAEYQLSLQNIILYHHEGTYTKL